MSQSHQKTRYSVTKILFLFFLLFTSLAVYNTFFKKIPVKKSSESKIVFRVVKNDNFESTVTIDGLVESEIDANVVSETTSVVENIYFKEGDYVKAGDLVMSLQPRSTVENLEVAELNYKTKKMSLHAAREMFESSLISQAEYNIAIAEHEQAESALKNVKNINKTKILAPFGGIITKIYVKKGDFVFGGGGMMAPAPVFHLVDNQNRLIVKATSSASLLKFIENKHKVKVCTEGSCREARLESHTSTLNPKTGTIELAVKPTEGQILNFGKTVDIVFSKNVKEVTRISYSLCQLMEGGRLAVKVIDSNDKVSLKMVTIVNEFNDGDVLVSGLENGDKIIIKGSGIVENGEILAKDRLIKQS